jgi:hypothetical protein
MLTLRVCVPPAQIRRGLALPPASAWVALALVMSCNEAGATVLGSLGTSVGLLAALGAMLMFKAWPAHASGGTLSALMGGVVVLFVGAAWWRRPTSMRRSNVTLPADIDRARLMGDLRALFIALQAAWDRGDIAALQSLTLPAMLDELCASRPVGAELQGMLQTEVLKLRAELLGFEALADVYLVSIDFSGLMRDAPDQPPAPFRELWMLTKAKQGGERWRLARHQALL